MLHNIFVTPLESLVVVYAKFLWNPSYF